jgi:hypothetical protein
MRVERHPAHTGGGRDLAHRRHDAATQQVMGRRDDRRHVALRVGPPPGRRGRGLPDKLEVAARSAAERFVGNAKIFTDDATAALLRTPPPTTCGTAKITLPSATMNSISRSEATGSAAPQGGSSWTGLPGSASRPVLR